jgi:hypothetical protein
MQSPSVSRPHWQQNFGLYWLAFVGLGSFGLLLGRSPGLHYFTFTGAAISYWQGAPIYGTAFVDGAPQYFYSPACAAFFYAIFAYLPPWWGRSIYMLVSLLALAGGIYALRAAYQARFGGHLDAGICGQLLWVMLSSELTGAIFADKLEVLILAMFFYALAFCWRDNFTPALILLGVVANWKFQSIPILALLLVALFRQPDRWRYLLTTVLTMVGLTVLPFLFQDGAYLWREMGVWQSTLSNFMADAWMAPIFHHVYGFLGKALGLPVAYEWAEKINVVVAVMLALVVAYQTYVRKISIASLAMLAFAFGAGFSVLFSPLSQGTGFIIYMPLPIALVYWFWRASYPQWILATIMTVAYFFTSLSVSDLTPKVARAYFYNHGFKALGALILLVWLLVQIARGEKTGREDISRP